MRRKKFHRKIWKSHENPEMSSQTYQGQLSADLQLPGRDIGPHPCVLAPPFNTRKMEKLGGDRTILKEEWQSPFSL